MDIKAGDKIEYRSIGGLLETMIVDDVQDTTMFGPLVYGQGRVIYRSRATRVLETAS